MENKLPFLSDEQANSVFAPAEPEAFPAVPALRDERPERQQRPRRAARPRPHKLWRLLLLLVTGLCCCALLLMLGALAWGYIEYARQGEVAGAVLLPLVIFLGAVFLSCCLITALSRGGTIFLSLLLAIAINLLALLVAEISEPQIGGLLLRLGLSLPAAVLGFTVSKLLLINGRRHRAGRYKTAA